MPARLPPYASLRLGMIDLEARPCPPGPTAPATQTARDVGARPHQEVLCWHQWGSRRQSTLCALHRTAAAPYSEDIRQPHRAAGMSSLYMSEIRAIGANVVL